MPETKSIISTWFVIGLLIGAVVGAGEGPPPPDSDDRCALCGMFVAKYPAWIATIEYRDGSRRYFDGPKDLFKYRARGEVQTEEVEIWVTDYYTTKPLKVREAVFVRGSDVMGPMGAELVPLASSAHAESFRADHGGDTPLVFDDVDEAVLRSFD